MQQSIKVGVTADVHTTMVLTMDEIGTVTAPRGDVVVPRTAPRIAAVYDAHHGELFSFALRGTRDREAAEDLLHEGFVRLIVEVEAGREPRNVRAWLYRVIANLIVSRGRRATVAQRQSRALVEHDAGPGPEPIALEHERQTDLEAILAELGTDARTALLMAANGFDGTEIAAAIGRTGNATRTLMCRARIQLRQRLAATETSA